MNKEEKIKSLKLLSEGKFVRAFGVIKRSLDDNELCSKYNTSVDVKDITPMTSYEAFFLSEVECAIERLLMRDNLEEHEIAKLEKIEEDPNLKKELVVYVLNNDALAERIGEDVLEDVMRFADNEVEV